MFKEKLLQILTGASVKCVVSVTGGGGSAVSWLMKTPGISSVLLEINVPYCKNASAEFLLPPLKPNGSAHEFHVQYKGAEDTASGSPNLIGTKAQINYDNVESVTFSDVGVDGFGRQGRRLKACSLGMSRALAWRSLMRTASLSQRGEPGACSENFCLKDDLPPHWSESAAQDSRANFTSTEEKVKGNFTFENVPKYIGLGVTCSLRTTKPKRGPHEAFITVTSTSNYAKKPTKCEQESLLHYPRVLPEGLTPCEFLGDSHCKSYYLEFEKDKLSREAEDHALGVFILTVLGSEALGVDPLDLFALMRDDIFPPGNMTGYMSAPSSAPWAPLENLEQTRLEVINSLNVQGERSGVEHTSPVCSSAITATRIYSAPETIKVPTPTLSRLERLSRSKDSIQNNAALKGFICGHFPALSFDLELGMCLPLFEYPLETRTVGSHRCDGQPPYIVVSGAFNPMHDGHLEMAHAAVDWVKRKFSGSRCTGLLENLRVIFELACINADKGELPMINLCERIYGIVKYPGIQSLKPLLVLSREALFGDKIRMYTTGLNRGTSSGTDAQPPIVIFVLGSDTYIRMIDQKYYSSLSDMEEMIYKLKSGGTHFLIAPRCTNGRIRDDLREPGLPWPAAMFSFLDGFRVDVSSTEIREKCSS